MSDSPERDGRFTYWLLKSLEPTLQGMNSDSAVPGLNRDAAHAIPLLVPPLDEQRRIASVLGALDEKIESNRRLASFLMQVVELAFARMASFARSTSTLGELGIVRGGGTPKSKVPEFWDPPVVPWVTPKDMTALAGVPVVWSGERGISEAGLAGSSARLLPAGSVLYTSRATLGLMAIAQQSLSTNQGFISIEPSEGLSPEFVFFAVRAQRSEIQAKASGSTFLEVNKTNFKSVPCVMPPEAERSKFDSLARPAFQLVAGLVSEVARLAKIRDELLPRLVSGRVRLSDADDHFSPSRSADPVSMRIDS